MNVVYRQIRSTKRTPASLAIEFNISKARINAIQKLKEVEDEMRRQVSRESSLPSSHPPTMMIAKSISLEDSHVVKNFPMHGFLILLTPLVSLPPVIS